MHTQAEEIKPLIPESSTSESTNVEVVLINLRDGDVQIPDYQRDSDQWSDVTKSLLIESVINNLSIPAFFFEVSVSEDGEKNQVIDGQQRLTTLYDFFNNKFRLVKSDDAPYISPNSIHYEGRTFDELPQAYQKAFRKYRLAIIKLRNLEGMRLEVFRRINQGGTPLSGQDIRLAYYGDSSPSLALIRLVGIYSPDRQAAKRFLENSKRQFKLSHPWKRVSALNAWNDWWEDKDIARGQTASESFLWSLVTAQCEILDKILQNREALAKIKVRFNKAIDEALDAYCAQLHWQDTHNEQPTALMSFDEMEKSFFPHFECWIEYLLVRGTSLPVTKHRMVAAIIGAAYRLKSNPRLVSPDQWTNVIEFIRRPADFARELGAEWPQSKGRWDGKKGYRAQMDACNAIVAQILQ